MSPVASLMIHNPSTVAVGDADEMMRAKTMLDTVKQTIINAYTLKSGQPRELVSEMMDAETWIYAQDAVGLGFADGMLYYGSGKPSERLKNMIYTRQAVSASFFDRIHSRPAPPAPSQKIRRSADLRDSIINTQISGGVVHE
jgi:Protease subunit of ATP-dependent Clp proteases